MCRHELRDGDGGADGDARDDEGDERREAAGTGQDAAPARAGGGARAPDRGGPEPGPRRTGGAPAADQDGTGRRRRGARGHRDQWRSAALDGRQVRGRGTGADRERQEDHRQSMRDLPCLRRHDRASCAVGEMCLDLRAVAFAEIAAGVGAEPIDGPVARGVLGHRPQVRLDPRLAEPFACAERQLRDRGRLHPQQGGDLGRLHLLDLRVPEHLLPARGQAAEGLVREAAVEGLVGGVRARVGILDGLELVDGRLSACAAPPRGGVADAREQVGAERPGGPAAVLDRAEDPRVGLLHEVVGIDARRDRLRHREPGTVVAAPELAECPGVARPCAQHEVGVGEVGRVVARVVGRGHRSRREASVGEEGGVGFGAHPRDASACML
ncbi:hypothetical protein MICABA_02103 [Microbacterium sp. T2.11-28]|nr:hypothetical protein MICABA_02103 [Microbacterium sp. T2.11-28]